eukprot:106055-Pleurochrysis_carterae.AAC.1
MFGACGFDVAVCARRDATSDAVFNRPSRPAADEAPSARAKSVNGTCGIRGCGTCSYSCCLKGGVNGGVTEGVKEALQEGMKQA